jgi:hypothetical protein
LKTVAKPLLGNVKPLLGNPLATVLQSTPLQTLAMDA